MSDQHNKNTGKRTAWNVKAEKSFTANTTSVQTYLEIDKFDDLIKSKGVRVKIYRTMYCPNVKSVDGAEHEIDCTVSGCNGSGFIDRHPLTSIAFIQNQDLEKMAPVEGLVDGNSVQITFLSGIELQYFTLVELLDFSDIYFQRNKRVAVGQIDALKYNALRINMIIDENGVEYFHCIDCDIDPSGNLRWKTGRGPAAGVIYSVHYEAAVQYRATKAMHVNRFTQIKGADGGISHVKFPEQWVCQKEFLVKRKDVDGNEITPNPY